MVLGSTLLELLLVVTIASSFILGGLKFARIYQDKVEKQKLLYNVDAMFQQLHDYYLTNCQNGTLATISLNFLSPYQYYGSTNSSGIAQLTSGMSIGVSLSTSNLLFSSLIDSTGYMYQLNLLKNDMTDNACVATSSGSPCTKYTQKYPSSVAQFLRWQLQVAVKMNNPNNNSTLIDRYKNITQADCSSSLNTATTPATVYSCAANKTGNYLVWTRSPSSAYVNKVPVLSLSTGTLQEFGVQYTHNRYYELNYVPAPNTSYYQCVF